MVDPLRPFPRPSGYSPPDWQQVSEILKQLKQDRAGVIERIADIKRARRSDWSESMKAVPAPFRKFVGNPDLPMIRDMIQRITGMMAKNPPVFQVTPASYRDNEVHAAAKEENRLNALRITIEDQQRRRTFAMGIDGQVANGESWIGVFLDSTRMDNPGFTRKDGESAASYLERYPAQMAQCGVPIIMEDFDAQTLFPLRSRERHAAIVVETEHRVFDIDVGLGYKATKKMGPNGQEGREWKKKTLSEGYVGNAARVAGSSNDTITTRDTGFNPANGTNALSNEKCTRTLWADQWVVLTFLDGQEVERWEHNWGFVPIVPANGEQSSDRDPSWQSAGLADAAMGVAKQLVMMAIVMSSSAMQHGFPTPFIKNPSHGLATPRGNEPRIRPVSLGQMNVLGSQEDIVFPFADAKLNADFFKNLEWLENQLEQSTISNFGKSIGSDMAGYAVAQIRAAQMSLLGPAYVNCASQWREIGYILRFIVKHECPGGIYLRGAVEERDDGTQYQPILRYGPDECTDDAINVVIEEGIVQDQAAQDKMAIEKAQANLWSPRRAMEKLGVEDPEAEIEEIRVHQMRMSPAYAQQVLTMALAMNAERYAAVLQAQNDPFSQLLVAARQKVLGEVPNQPGLNPGGSQPATQGALPGNADASGAPITPETQPPAAPLQQGAGVGARGIDLKSMAIPQMAGGVTGSPQVAGQ